MKIIDNNSLSLKDLEKQVELYGFVARKRNLGGLIFIDLRVQRFLYFSLSHFIIGNFQV